MFELFSDIESQGIKKLTDKSGELSKIGRQNLKFCIEQNHQKINKESNSILNFFKSKIDNNENLSNISLLSTHMNENQSDGKEERKKFLENERENNGKNNENNDSLKLDFKDDELILKKKIKCKKISLWTYLILTIIGISVMSIVFFYK